MDQIYEIYNQFIGYFPHNIQWAVSAILAVLIIWAVIKVLSRQFIYIILLVVLLPASVPIFKNVWNSVAQVIKFLLTRH
ncbi:MAG: hypothetical protein ACM3KM_03205 [Acidobacteriaceae bacterium]